MGHVGPRRVCCCTMQHGAWEAPYDMVLQGTGLSLLFVTSRSTKKGSPKCFFFLECVHKLPMVFSPRCKVRGQKEGIFVGLLGSLKNCKNPLYHNRLNSQLQFTFEYYSKIYEKTYVNPKFRGTNAIMRFRWNTILSFWYFVTIRCSMSLFIGHKVEYH